MDAPARHQPRAKGLHGTSAMSTLMMARKGKRSRGQASAASDLERVFPEWQRKRTLERISDELKITSEGVGPINYRVARCERREPV